MFNKIAIFLLIVPAVHSAVAVFPTKVGDFLLLDLGKDIHEWHRVRNGQEEVIRYCEDDKQAPSCNRWVDKGMTPVDDGHGSIFANGTLLIDPFELKDAGDYFSNDELERVHYSVDGRYMKLARTRISVIAI
ncbi:unnamed protein product [Caenorhabditis auriculariae]|uniref:Uncharacterized protein n=1 Tax=Caenorhabditis auriculariae TaxID=2777116 RepID=A0A8S1H0N8_9PELO|nr:unnamed protein product [Caenorhabditis auriculariae]